MPFDKTNRDRNNFADLTLITEAHFHDERVLHHHILNSTFYEFKIKEYLTDQISIVSAGKKAQDFMAYAVTTLLLSAGFFSFFQNPVSLINMLFAGMVYIYAIGLVIKSPDLDPEQFETLEKNLNLISDAARDDLKAFVYKKRRALQLFEMDTINGRTIYNNSPTRKVLRKFV